MQKPVRMTILFPISFLCFSVKWEYFYCSNFVQPQSFRGDVYFSWRGMTSYSSSCFGGNFCRLFAQFWVWLCVCLRLLCTFVYGFCARCADFSYVYGFAFAHAVRIFRMYADFYFTHNLRLLHTYTAFVRVVRLLRTYMAYHLRTLCGIFVCIQILCPLCVFCIRIQFFCTLCFFCIRIRILS